MVHDLVGKHEGAIDVPHANGRPACHHEDNMPSAQKVFAYPPVLIGLNLDGPVVEKIGDHVVHVGSVAFGEGLQKRLGAQDDEGAAFDHDLELPDFLIQKLLEILPLHAPHALVHALHSDKAVAVCGKVLVPGVFHVHPGDERTGGAQYNAVLVLLGKLAKNVPHFGNNIQGAEMQILVAPKLHACPLADEGDLLTVRENIDILPAHNASRGVDTAFYEGHARKLFHQLIGDDCVFLDGGYDNAALAHTTP